MANTTMNTKFGVKATTTKAKVKTKATVRTGLEGMVHEDLVNKVREDVVMQRAREAIKDSFTEPSFSFTNLEFQINKREYEDKLKAAADRIREELVREEAVDQPKSEEDKESDQIQEDRSKQLQALYKKYLGELNKEGLRDK